MGFLSWYFTYSDEQLEQRKQVQRWQYNFGDDRAKDRQFMRTERLKVREKLGQIRKTAYVGPVDPMLKSRLAWHLWKQNQSAWQYTFHHTKVNNLQTILDIIEKN